MFWKLKYCKKKLRNEWIICLDYWYVYENLEIRAVDFSAYIYYKYIETIQARRLYLLKLDFTHLHT